MNYNTPLLSNSLTNTIPFYDDVDQAAEAATTKAHLPRTYSFKDSIATSFSNLSLRHFLTDNTAKPRKLLSRAKSSLTRMHSQLNLLPLQSRNNLIPRSMTGVYQPFTLNRSDLSSTSRRHLNQNEPIVHYNGPNQTLESFTADELKWIRAEPANASFFFKKNPLTDYHQSIVLRKPLKLSNAECGRQQKDTLKPRAMYYLRIVQSFLIDSSKSRILRCNVIMDNDVCYTTFVPSRKSGKNSAIAEFDETFLFDIERPTTVTIGLYAQNRGLLRRKKSHLNLTNVQQQPLLQQHEDDICLGSATMTVDMKAKAKMAERIILESHNNIHSAEDSTSTICPQLLVVHGVYLSQRVQDYLCNSTLHSDYITVQVRQHSSSLSSYRHKRWVRFWGVLRGIHLELYDRQYKEKHKAMYVIPLYYFISTLLQNTMVDQERGITLQFTDGALDEDELQAITEEEEQKKRRQFSYEYSQEPAISIEEELSYCICMLADSTEAKQVWEEKMDYVGSIFDELRRWNFEDDEEVDDADSQISDNNSFYYAREAETLGYSQSSSIFEEELEGKNLAVPLELLW